MFGDAVMAVDYCGRSAVSSTDDPRPSEHRCADAGLAAQFDRNADLRADGSLWLTWAAAGRISVARCT